MAHLPSNSSSAQRHFDTIVIGAGISGLACASRLHEHHHGQSSNRLCVLEARDRIGGRIHSVYLHGSRLDTGANWIHGTGTEEEPNPLMHILPHKRYRPLAGMISFRPPPNTFSQHEQHTSDTPDGDEWVDVQSSATAEEPASSGDLVIPSKFASTITQTLWATIGSLHEAAFSMSEAEAGRTSMLSALTHSETYREAFDNIPPSLHPTLSGMPQFLEPMEAAPLAAQSAEHAQGSPGMSLAEYAIDDFDGDQVFLQDGYIAIIEELARPLVEAGLINLGVEVKQIAWEEDPISIQTSVGTYTANNVVCTLPLGVLKNRQQNAVSQVPFFTPSLPREKTQAIYSLGYGTLDKIFMVYSSPWWTEEPFASILNKGFAPRPGAVTTYTAASSPNEVDSFAGYTHELPGLAISQDGTITAGPRLLSMTNLHSLCGFPVLCAFVSCANAAQIETMSDSDAGALVRRSLNTWFGQKTPEPKGVHVTRWAQDPYSFGSYSHMITNLSKKEHRAEFQKPLSTKQGKGTLRFAGEHTSRNHFATAHGALLSGWREADQILTTTR